MENNQSDNNSTFLTKLFKYTSITTGLLLMLFVLFELGNKLYYIFSSNTVYDQIKLFDQLEINENKHLNGRYLLPDDSAPDSNNGISISFYRRISSVTYKGKWLSESEIFFFGERREGEMSLRVERLIAQNDVNKERILILFRLLDGHYIDKWAYVKSDSFLYSNNTKSIIPQNIFSGKFYSHIDYGEIFDRTNSSKPCLSNFIFNVNDTESETILSNLNGEFKSDCGFSIKFELLIDDDTSDYNKVVFYSIFVSIMTILQIIGSLWMLKKIGDSETISRSISLFTIGQSIIWNSYGCLCHFFLTVNYDIFSYQFGVPAFLYFTNFSIFELRLMYTIWRNQNARNFINPAMIRKKLIQFYFTFYIFMFFSLFYVLKFYFDKTWIFVAVSITWIPQILNNIYRKNKLSMPFMNILLISTNRLFLPLYFRGCPDNFFQLSHDYNFVFICFASMLIQILILYSQTLFGPRWFLPKRFIISGFNFYKTKYEVLLIKPDADILDCVICLYNLFATGNENFKYSSDDFMSIDSAPKTKFKIVLDKIREVILEFHEHNFDIDKKPFMMTPCRHFFHTNCLESWFKQKKECPSCRQEIDNITH